MACEESQRVCRSFRERGHDAFSCDILTPSGGLPEFHLLGDVRDRLGDGWDLMIAHPPCTYLSNVGQQWFNVERHGAKAIQRERLRQEAFEFVKELWAAPIPRIAIENPIGWLNTHWQKPSQTIQPFHFGEPDRKATCLWLRDLAHLIPTEIVEPRAYYVMKEGPKAGRKLYYSDSRYQKSNRSRNRSRTFWGIARAMAAQWG